jgi:hypothetical protein
MINKEYIDYSDIPEINVLSKGRKNPHAEKIKKEGYSVTVHYSPEDVANGDFDDTKDIVAALVDLMSKEEATRLLLHIKENYNLACSPNVWHCIEGQSLQPGAQPGR